MATVPIDLALSVVVGSSVALAARSTAGHYKLLRSPAFWSLLAFELLVFAPLGAWRVWRFPAWSFMYLVDPASLPLPGAYLALLYPLVGVGTFVACSRLITAHRVLAVVGVLAAGVALVGIIGFFGSDQLVRLGTTAEFRSDPVQMRELEGSTLAWVGSAGLVVVLVGWIATVWRLHLLGRAVAINAQPPVTAPPRDVSNPQSKSRASKKST